MTRVAPSAFAAPASVAAVDQDDTASETSEHSYTLEDVQVTRRASTHASMAETAPSLGRSSVISNTSTVSRRAFSIDLSAPALRGQTDVRVALRARPAPMPKFEESRPTSRDNSFDRLQLRNRLGSPRHSDDGQEQEDTVRIDIAPPPGMTIEDIEEADEITGRIVRKRRRIPVPVVLVFGMTTCVCFCLGCIAVTLGSLNYSRIAKGKAAKSVADLDNEITPLIHAIYGVVVGNVTAASYRMSKGLRLF